MRKVVLVLVVFSLVFSLTACNVKENITKKEQQVVQVGFIAPLTGDAAVLGDSWKKITEMALEKANKEGYVKIEMIYGDGKCDAKEALSSFRKLISVDGIKITYAAACSNGALAMVPAADSSKTLLFSPASTSPKLSGISDNFLRIYPSDVAGGEALAGLAIAKGWDKVAFVVEQEEYSLGFYNTFKKEFDNNKEGIILKQEFASGEKDFRSILLKLQQEKPDVLFISTQAGDAPGNILKQLAILDWKPQLMVNDAISGDPEISKQYVEQLQGVLTAQFSIDENNIKFSSLINEYKERYGEEPPYQNYASVVYDGVFILKEAIEKYGNNPEKVAEYIEGLEDWEGASGLVTVENGDRSTEGSFVIKQFRQGKWEIVD